MKTLTLIGALLLAAPLAHAHVSIEQTSAAAGSYQKLTFRVGHGCQGGAATDTFIVVLPEAFGAAKPMPKAGWTISTDKPREVTWKGGPLPDAYYDEFSMQVKLPDAPGKHYFKATQLCDKARVDWQEIPGAAGVKLKEPAPVFEILPPAAGAHQH